MSKVSGKGAGALDLDAPVVVVSGDSHVGPLLREQLRDYCPKAYLERFDAYCDEADATKNAMREMFEQFKERAGDSGSTGSLRNTANLERPGHHDAAARLADMDYDGVAAEIIWHFSQNGEDLPWVGIGLGTVAADQHELGGVAYHMYNEWLADFCAADPERLLGLVYLPTWDIDATVKELQWARERGLRAVNFPACSRPGVLEYNNLAWEPFWSACEDLGMALCTHSSGGPLFDYTSGIGGMHLAAYEGGGYMSRRAVWWLTFGEVFERHPDLKLVITEQYEGWFVPTMRELDQVFLTFGMGGSLKKLPSEYVREHVYLGASFMSTFQADEAVAEDYVDNVIWGRDYPHVEGTYQYVDDPDMEPVCKQALRWVMSRVSAEDAVKMAGENAINVFGLDRAYLTKVAEKMGALTARELTTPLVTDPPEVGGNGFRGQAGPRPLDEGRLAIAQSLGLATPS